jgi:hypothetical protein
MWWLNGPIFGGEICDTDSGFIFGDSRFGNLLWRWSLGLGTACGGGRREPGIAEARISAGCVECKILIVHGTKSEAYPH